MGDQRFGWLIILFVLLIPLGHLVASERVTLSTVYEIKGPPGGAFGAVLNVAVDERGGLIVLDMQKKEIHRFDENGRWNSIVDMRPEGDAPWYPRAIFASEGRLYVLEGRNVLIRDLDGGAVRTVPVQGMIAMDFYVHDGDIVLPGNKKGSEDTFHVLDENGNGVAAFGGRFAVPDEISEDLPEDYDPKDLSVPQKFYYLPSEDELFVANPFRYEIQVYRGRKLFRALTHDASYSTFAGGIRHWGPSGNMGFSTGFIGYPSVVRRGDVLLVFRPKSPGRADYCVDLFKDYAYQSTQDLDIKGLPVVADQEGNVYTVEYNGIAHTASIIKMRLTIE
jgi:hypothetical protein